MEKWFIAIDLKSFYASVECKDEGIDPLRANLVVADPTRTDKTICLAVSPALKSFGIPGRPRLFEVRAAVEEFNRRRLGALNGKPFSGKSIYADEIRSDPTLELDFHIAPPHMARYMEISTQIVRIYLDYVSAEDMHIYSVDEVFCDVTSYLHTYGISAHELCRRMITDVYNRTGITATGGIGTNMYLCKIAMDIVAKHMEPDANGVRIAQLDEMSYRRYLWTHRPITDFWRIGSGYAKRLAANGMYTMGDVARCSLDNEDLLYRLFGINAGFLIDHAWGYEDTTIAEVHSYVPRDHSISSGQVLQTPYEYKAARLITREMTELLVLDLVDKRMVCDQVVLDVGYDIENLTDPERRSAYHGPIVTDRYGRQIPKGAHGSRNLGGYSSSTRKITDAMVSLFEEIADPALLVRRINVTAAHVISEDQTPRQEETYEQMDLFTDYAALEKKQKQDHRNEERERRAQEAVLSIQKKYGKNAILKGMNLEEGAMTIERNAQIGGHKA